MATSAEVVEWQTRTFEGRVGVSPCGFKSRLRHQLLTFAASNSLLCEIIFNGISKKAGLKPGVLKGVFPVHGVTGA